MVSAVAVMFVQDYLMDQSHVIMLYQSLVITLYQSLVITLYQPHITTYNQSHIIKYNKHCKWMASHCTPSAASTSSPCSYT